MGDCDSIVTFLMGAKGTTLAWNLAILLLLYFQCLGLGAVQEVVTSVFIL